MNPDAIAVSQPTFTVTVAAASPFLNALFSTISPYTDKTDCWGEEGGDGGREGEAVTGREVRKEGRVGRRELVTYFWKLGLSSLIFLSPCFLCGALLRLF